MMAKTLALAPEDILRATNPGSPIEIQEPLKTETENIV